MIFEQKKLKVNLHFSVGEFQLSRHHRNGRHRSSDLDGHGGEDPTFTSIDGWTDGLTDGWTDGWTDGDICDPVVILLVKKDLENFCLRR